MISYQNLDLQRKKTQTVGTWGKKFHCSIIILVELNKILGKVGTQW